MFSKTYLKHTYKYKLSFEFLSALHAAFISTFSLTFKDKWTADKYSFYWPKNVSLLLSSMDGPKWSIRSRFVNSPLSLYSRRNLKYVYHQLSKCHKYRNGLPVVCLPKMVFHLVAMILWRFTAYIIDIYLNYAYYQFWFIFNSVFWLIFQFYKWYSKFWKFIKGYSLNEMLNTDFNDFGIHTFQQEL